MTEWYFVGCVVAYLWVVADLVSWNYSHGRRWSDNLPTAMAAGVVLAPGWPFLLAMAAVHAVGSRRRGLRA